MPNPAESTRSYAAGRFVARPCVACGEAIHEWDEPGVVVADTHAGRCELREASTEDLEAIASFYAEQREGFRRLASRKRGEERRIAEGELCHCNDLLDAVADEARRRRDDASDDPDAAWNLRGEREG